MQHSAIVDHEHFARLESDFSIAVSSWFTNRLADSFENARLVRGLGPKPRRKEDPTCAGHDGAWILRTTVAKSDSRKHVEVVRFELPKDFSPVNEQASTIASVLLKALPCDQVHLTVVCVERHSVVAAEVARHARINAHDGRIANGSQSEGQLTKLLGSDGVLDPSETRVSNLGFDACHDVSLPSPCTDLQACQHRL